MLGITGRETIPMRLRDAVAKGRRAKLFAAFGPMGSGRSTLLALYERPLASDPSNYVVRIEGARMAGEPGAFWKALAEGLGTGPDKELADAERALSERFDERAVNGLLDAVFHVVEKRGLEYYCVIDDIDALLPTRELRVVQALVDRSPGHVHIAIGGLRNPGIALSRLRLSRDVVEVGSSDLLLTDQEAADAVRALCPHIDRGAIERVVQLAHGWAAALAMLTIEAGETDDPAAVLDECERGEGWVADFLHEEIIPGLSRQARACLMRLGVLGRFDSRLVSRACPEVSFERALDEMVCVNVVVKDWARGEGERQLYRCHPLFRQSLRMDALRELGPDEARELNGFAVDWCDERGDYDEAVALAASAGDGQRAFEVVCNHLFAILADAEGSSLSVLLEKMPHPSPGDAYLHSLLKAYASILMGRASLARRWLIRAEEAKPASALQDERVRRSAEAIFQTVTIGTMVFDGRYKAAVDQGQELASRLGGPWLFMRASVLHHVGEALERLGRYEEALESVTRAKVDAELSNRRIVELLCDCESMWLLFIEGRLDAASNIALRTLAACSDEEKAASWAVGLLYVGMARLYLQWLETDKSMAYAEKARELLGVSSNADAYIESQVTLARCLVQAGDSEGAFDMLLECYERLQLEYVPRGVDLLALVTFAEVLVARGDCRRAENVLNEALGKMDPSDWFYRVHVDVTSARIDALEGRLTDARDTLEAALDCSARMGVGLMVPDCQIQLASVLAMLGEDSAAEELMADALVACAEEGRLYPFREPLPSQLPILRSLAYARNSNLVQGFRRERVAEFAREVLMAFDGRRVDDLADSSAGAVAADALSERERQIYELLKQGKTRREISEELDIRVNTVRTHVRNIYKKLGIHDRSML